jgi:hypothetical protein
MKVDAGMRYRSVGLGFCGGSRRGVFEVLSVAAFGNNVAHAKLVNRHNPTDGQLISMSAQIGRRRTCGDRGFRGRGPH